MKRQDATVKQTLKIMKSLSTGAKKRRLYVPIFKVPTNIDADRSIKKSPSGAIEVRVNLKGRTIYEVASDLALGIAISNGLSGYRAELVRSSLLREVLQS
jgi:hypothetical protein